MQSSLDNAEQKHGPACDFIWPGRLYKMIVRLLEPFSSIGDLTQTQVTECPDLLVFEQVTVAVFSTLEISCGKHRVRAVPEVHGVARITPERLPERIDRGIQIPRRSTQVPQVVVRLTQSRIDLQGPSVTGTRLVGVSRGLVDQTQVAVGLGEPGLNPQRSCQ